MQLANVFLQGNHCRKPRQTGKARKACNKGTTESFKQNNGSECSNYAWKIWKGRFISTAGQPCLPSTLIHQQSGAFRKRSLKMELCEIEGITIFVCFPSSSFPQTLIQRACSVIVAFFKFFLENIWWVVQWKHRFQIPPLIFLLVILFIWLSKQTV